MLKKLIYPLIPFRAWQKKGNKIVLYYFLNVCVIRYFLFILFLSTKKKRQRKGNISKEFSVSCKFKFVFILVTFLFNVYGSLVSTKYFYFSVKYNKLHLYKIIFVLCYAFRKEEQEKGIFIVQIAYLRLFLRAKSSISMLNDKNKKN